MGGIAAEADVNDGAIGLKLQARAWLVLDGLDGRSLFVASCKLQVGCQVMDVDQAEKEREPSAVGVGSFHGCLTGWEIRSSEGGSFQRPKRRQHLAGIGQQETKGKRKGESRGMVTKVPGYIGCGSANNRAKIMLCNQL